MRFGNGSSRRIPNWRSECWAAVTRSKGNHSSSPRRSRNFCPTSRRNRPMRMLSPSLRMWCWHLPCCNPTTVIGWAKYSCQHFLRSRRDSVFPKFGSLADGRGKSTRGIGQARDVREDSRQLYERERGNCAAILRGCERCQLLIDGGVLLL